MFMSKSKSFGGIPLTMSWYMGPFPGSAPASSQPPRRPHQGQFGSAPTAGSFQQAAPVISDGAGDSIELKLAPVQQGLDMRGPRGGGGWGDDFGKEEGVGWGGDVWGKRKNNNGGTNTYRCVFIYFLVAIAVCPFRLQREILEACHRTQETSRSFCSPRGVSWGLIIVPVVHGSSSFGPSFSDLRRTG